MGIIGISVKIITKVETGEKDHFGAPVYSFVEEAVSDVLVSPASGTEVVEKQSLYGKKAVYNLGIPKGDTHEWEDAEVEFYGKRWRVFGPVLEGIEENIPLRWNKKVTVERYE